MKLHFSNQTRTSNSLRANQIASMFDVPPAEKCSKEYEIDFPWNDKPWNVGLVVGPSGSGKTSVLRNVWGEPAPLVWTGSGMVDDFSPSLSVDDIASACGSVGLNTIPAWVRPHAVLSNGEKFRAEIARRLLETPAETPIVIDEFSSVVDRQVAQICSHAVAKVRSRQ